MCSELGMTMRGGQLPGRVDMPDERRSDAECALEARELVGEIFDSHADANEAVVDPELRPHIGRD